MYTLQRNIILVVVSRSLPIGVLICVLVWAGVGTISGGSTTAIAAGSLAKPQSACRLPIKTTITSTGRQCDPIDVAVRVTIACPVSLPLHLVVALDRSLAMRDDLSQAKQAARRAISALDFSLAPPSKVSVLSHGDAVQTEIAWTDNPVVAEGAVNGVTYRAADNEANPGAAMAAALELLSKARGEDRALEAVLLVGAGCPTADSACASSLRQGADSMSDAGASTLAVCFAADQGDCRSYRDAASSSRVYLDGPGYRIDRAIETVLSAGQSLSASEVVLKEYVDTYNFRYIPGSGIPVPTVEEDETGFGLKQILRFTWRDHARGTSVFARYRLQAPPGRSGSGAIRGIGGWSRISLIDSLGRSLDISINENPQAPGRPPCGVGTATPTATQTKVPTLTPSPSPTDVPATATHPPPTIMPAPMYLPLLLREQCIPGQHRMDVVLVIDASSSMLEPTVTGRSRLSAAIEAAQVFLDQVRLGAGDQAAVVMFNNDAWLAATLTTDRSALDTALEGIQTAQFTRIDRGIAIARQELLGSRRNEDSTPVMIVLTDGRANPVPVDVAIVEARLAKEAGVQLFTIGLGADLDAEALAQMASLPEWFYVAPDAEDLVDIYRAIAVTIPCPMGNFWGVR